MKLLEVRNTYKSFGANLVLKDVNLKVEKAMIKGLIGPNGAGKTTLFNLINGIEELDAGELYFKEERVDGLKPHEIARKGIGRTFQIPRIFPEMNVMDGISVAGVRLYRSKEKLKNKVVELMRFFEIAHLKNELAKNLSGGQKKLLEMARTLVTDPDLILLDEPFHGVHAILKEKIIEKIKILRKEENKTFLIISHDIPSIANVCNRISVLSAGNIIGEGSPKEIRKNSKVTEAYLGVDHVS